MTLSSEESQTTEVVYALNEQSDDMHFIAYKVHGEISWD